MISNMGLPMPNLPCRLVSTVFFCAALAACGGGGGGGGSAPPPTQSFSVGGTVSGLDAVGLVLQNNGGADLPITANGAFTFPAQIASGATYAVTIKTQPSVGPVQLCSVANGSGTVASSPVTNVAITCASRVFKFLYTTSTTTNELSGYSIDASSGALAALPGYPVATGIGPGLPIPHPSGNFVFVATRGNLSVPPMLAVYAADNTTGALNETAGSPYDLSTPAPQPGPVVVLPPSIHRSGAFGHLPVLYSTTLLFGAAIDATTGALTQLPGTPIDMGAGIGGMFYDSTGGFLFIPANPNGNGEIRTFLVNTPSGVLTPIGTFPTGGGPAAAFLAPGENYLLATNFNSGTLMVFSVNKAAGTLTPITTPIATGPAGSQPLGLIFNRRNNIFYVTHIRTGLTPNAPTSVAAFNFDPATGGVTPIGTPTASNGAGSFASLHPSGRFLFQYNSSTASIQRFTLDATTGAPTLAADVTALPGASQQVTLILDVSGKYLYATDPGASTVSSYSVDAATGALTLINFVPTSPGSLATLPFLLQ
jgi:6-phosphogluconolactonase (cycloisomerase 2 family)